MKQRPSGYLEDRCETVERVLDTYLAAEQAAPPTADELLLYFAAQLPYWNAELEVLIGSFDDFERLAQSWQSEKGVEESLKAQGIYINARALKYLRKEQNDKKSGGTKVIAPAARLNRIIEKWNHLLALMGERLVAVEESPDDQPRGRAPLDLKSLRKKTK